jgi:ArsR family transcriptional regulator
MFSQTHTQAISQLEADLFTAFVDSTRILILYALSEHPHNVTELTTELDIPQPKISRHLKVLRDHGLVRTTRHGVSILYALADDRLIDALNILRVVLRDQLAYKANMVSELSE